LGVNVTHHIHVLPVIDALVLVPIGMNRELVIDRIVVGVHGALRQDALRDDRENCGSLRVWRYAGEHAAFPAALYDAEHGSLAVIVASALDSAIAMLILALSAYVCFIHLNAVSLQLHVRFGQQRANLAEHAPCGFIGNSGFALNLFRTNPAASRSHQ
jgi:hypothetical protein